MKITIPIVSIGLLNAAAAFAASSVDEVAVGKAIAQSHCAYCHVVSKDPDFRPVVQPNGSDFTAVAANPRMTIKFLRTFLMTTHKSVGKTAGMPNPLLTNGQINAVASYVLSRRP